MSNPMGVSVLATLRVLWACSVVGFAASVAYARTRTVDSAQQDHYSRALRSVQAEDATLDEDVLRTRLGLLTHYDPLVGHLGELRRLHGALRRMPGFLSPAGRRETALRLRASEETLRQQEGLVNAFTTEHAVLRNSVRFFPIAAAELAARARASVEGQPFAAAVDDLLGDVLLFNLVPDREVLPRIARRMEAVTEARRRWSPADARVGVDAAVMLAHARVILDRKPTVDGIVGRLVGLPAARRAGDLDATYSRHYRAALDVAATLRVVLFLEALAIVALASGYVILRLRRAADALRAATAQLEKVNEALRREQAREKELSDLKSRFVSTTSHEFKTPLSIILSSADMLDAYGDQWNSDKRRSHVDRIRVAVGRMNSLLDDILLLGRADAGRLEFRPATLDLQHFCAELADDLRATDGGRHRVEVVTRGDGTIVADERLLQRVLGNLLSNAIKYSPAGSTVHFEATTSAAETVFEVRDAGIGIPDEDRACLFESFHRARNVGAVSGTGLGMAIAKRALDLHGGSIDVTSELGRGTRCVVKIPSPVAP